MSEPTEILTVWKTVTAALSNCAAKVRAGASATPSRVHDVLWHWSWLELSPVHSAEVMLLGKW